MASYVSLGILNILIIKAYTLKVHILSTTEMWNYATVVLNSELSRSTTERFHFYGLPLLYCMLHTVCHTYTKRFLVLFKNELFSRPILFY